MSTPRLARSLAALAASIAPLTGTSCEDPLAPEEVAGVYVLRSVGGEQLPVVIGTDPESRTVVSGRIEIFADGTGEVSHSEIEGGEVQSWTVPITYEIAARGRFVAAIVCPPEAQCTEPPHFAGFFGDGSLQLYRHALPGNAWLFELAATAGGDVEAGR